MTRTIEIYDTTLRDGSQGEGIFFTLKDKLKILSWLDEVGISFIEGGWPNSNPKDSAFFAAAKSIKLQHAKLVPFGSTRRAKNKANQDPNLLELVAAETEYVTIFGKSWDFHVKSGLRIPLSENLDIISESVAFLTAAGRQVIYDAEHFFDGYKHNPEYAIASLSAASQAGAVRLVLCDTNGGTMPSQLVEAIASVSAVIKTPLGIHTHNDSDLAVANSLAALEHNCVQVHGTINGYGERCGNVNLCTLIPLLEIKKQWACLPQGMLAELTHLSRRISELANLVHREDMPFVGNSAFAHKAGIHVNAIRKNPQMYEHLDPGLIGNKRRFLVSELSGTDSIRIKARELNLDLDNDSELATKLVQHIKHLEHKGYQFEGADGSFKLLLLKMAKNYHPIFQLLDYRVFVSKKGTNGDVTTEATLKLLVDGQVVHTAAEGNGPINAMDNALRKALKERFPTISQMHLSDFRVRILDSSEGTGAITRVLIESSDQDTTWGTVGCSENIIEASWEALVDAVEFKLFKDHDWNTEIGKRKNTKPIK